jgi:PAS domain S-box-containing protein
MKGKFSWKGGIMEKLEKTQKPRGGYLDALLEGSPYAVIAIEGKGIITFVNKAATQLIGCENRDLVGKSIVTVYETEKHARETNRKLYLGGGIVHDHESVVKTKGGKLIPVRISAAHLKDSSRKYVGAVGFFEAYRPWKTAESKVKERCQELEAEIEEWRDLGAPVFEPLRGLSVSVITGRLDAARFERIRRNIVEHVRYRKTRVVVIDLSAVVGGDAEVGKQLVKTVRIVELVGAKCMLVGIDSVIAQALEAVVTDAQSLKTYSSFEAGMGDALALLGYEVVKKSNGENVGQDVR